MLMKRNLALIFQVLSFTQTSKWLMTSPGPGREGGREGERGELMEKASLPAAHRQTAGSGRPHWSSTALRLRGEGRGGTPTHWDTAPGTVGPRPRALEAPASDSCHSSASASHLQKERVWRDNLNLKLLPVLAPGVCP